MIKGLERDLRAWAVSEARARFWHALRLGAWEVAYHQARVLEEVGESKHGASYCPCGAEHLDP